MDAPLAFPEDATLATIPSSSDATIVKPPGVMTLRQWGEQTMGGGKHAGKTFSDILAIDASYVEFMKKKSDCTSAWALSFHNYVLAVDRMTQPESMGARQQVLTPQMIKMTKEEWSQQGAIVTDWDVIDELKNPHGSEVPQGITSLASGPMTGERMATSSDDHKKMQVDMQKETRDRVNQIQTQIAILQRELTFLMPAEEP